jgi:hypothetical protein
MRIFLEFLRDQRGSMAADIAKSAIAIAFISVIAANLVSRQIGTHDKVALDIVAEKAARGQQVDMNAVGSIAREANRTRLDPCVDQPRR